MPLVIFKKEKEISRSLEFDGMWIAEQPPDDDFLAHWDKIVISTRSFPDKYWDKFVKKKVCLRHQHTCMHRCLKRTNFVAGAHALLGAVRLRAD